MEFLGGIAQAFYQPLFYRGLAAEGRGIGLRYCLFLAAVQILLLSAQAGGMAAWRDFRQNSAALSEKVRALPTIERLIAAYAPWGSGLGTFEQVFKLHEPDALLSPSYLNHAHNDWLELVAADPAATYPFYERVLGLGVSEMRVGDEPYGLFDVGETSVAGAYRSEGEDQPHWLLYFNVADLDAAVVRATELGGTLRTEPQSAAGVGRWTEIVDPQGAVFGLLEPEPEPV